MQVIFVNSLPFVIIQFFFVLFRSTAVIDCSICCQKKIYFLGGNLNETVEFTIDVGSRTSKVNADVDGPSDTRPYAEVSNNQDGTYTVRYTPVAVGTHHIFITINDQQLPGGPIETQVADPASVAVSSVQYEEGLLYIYIYCSICNFSYLKEGWKCMVNTSLTWCTLWQPVQIFDEQKKSF